MSGCALFGKIVSGPEFVRLGASSDHGVALQRWLSSAVQAAEGVVPEVAVRFVASLDENRPACAGAWVASRDSLGRAFPLAIYTTLGEDMFTFPWSSLPAMLSRFFDEALAKLERLVDGSAIDPSLALESLLPPHPSELPGAWERCAQHVLETTCEAFAEDVFGEDASHQWSYARQTLRYAQDLARTGTPPGLVFPLHQPLDAFPWLELAAPVWEGAARPSLFWVQAPRTYLLVTPGAPRDLMRWLPSLSDLPSSIWPLWTRSGGSRKGADSAPLHHPVLLQHLLPGLAESAR